MVPCARRSAGSALVRVYSRISAIWWMPYYPIWSLTYIAIDVLVIYALAAYGGQAETA
jgi:hypothetical protein